MVSCHFICCYHISVLLFYIRYLCFKAKLHFFGSCMRNGLQLKDCLFRSIEIEVISLQFVDSDPLQAAGPWD